VGKFKDLLVLIGFEYAFLTPTKITAGFTRPSRLSGNRLTT
jgi:hypothetical protein